MKSSLYLKSMKKQVLLNNVFFLINLDKIIKQEELLKRIKEIGSLIIDNVDNIDKQLDFKYAVPIENLSVLMDQLNQRFEDNK